MFKEYDSFDVALALYHWLQHNWASQGDPLYQAFCELTKPGMFRPARRQEYFDGIDYDAKEVYGVLTLENYEDALNQVLNYESRV